MRHFAEALTIFFVLVYLDLCGQNERVLLFESFTNTGCENCAQQIPGLDSLIAANSDKVAAIQYHVNWPSASDPMYMRNPTDNIARIDYYEVTGVPHIVIDGNHFSGTPVLMSQNIINQLLSIEASAELHLDIETDEVGGTLSAHVTGRCITAFSDLKLFVGIIEKEVHFNSAPDPNGECVFHNVIHSLLPDALGQPIEHLEANKTFDYYFTCPLSNFYDLKQLGAIAWIQLSNNKTVLQACKANGQHDLGETSHETPCVYPNPTTGEVSITSPTSQTVSIFNLYGQCVFEGCCHDILHLNLRDFGSGMFILQVGSHIQKVNVL